MAERTDLIITKIGKDEYRLTAEHYAADGVTITNSSDNPVTMTRAELDEWLPEARRRAESRGHSFIVRERMQQ